jgi:predicted cupin superfamily sugar epimerase
LRLNLLQLATRRGTFTGEDMAQTAIRRTVDGAFIEELERPALAVQFGLEPHPEGGWYGRSWTAPDTVTVDGRSRPAATLILFLLPAGEFSAWHRVSSTEYWIFNGLAPVTLQLGGTGDAPVVESESVLDQRMPQLQIDANVWQRTMPSGADALVSCMVSPGFDFADFELAE